MAVEWSQARGAVHTALRGGPVPIVGSFWGGLDSFFFLINWEYCPVHRGEVFYAEKTWIYANRAVSGRFNHWYFGGGGAAAVRKSSLEKPECGYEKLASQYS